MCSKIFLITLIIAISGCESAKKFDQYLFLKEAEEIKKEVEKHKQKAIIVSADILNDADIKEMISKGIRAFDKIDVLAN